MHSGEFLLIDMDTLCRGNAVYEFAGMFNAYIAYNEPDRENAMQFFGVSADVTEYLFNKTLERYLATDDEDVISRAFKKAALVGYTEMVKTFAEEDENSVATAHYKEKLIELINEVNELSF